MIKKSRIFIWMFLNILLVVGSAYYFYTPKGIDPEGGVLLNIVMLIFSTLPTLFASALFAYVLPDYTGTSIFVFILTWLIIGGLGYFQWFMLAPWVYKKMFNV